MRRGGSIWRKSASPAWLARQAARLHEQTRGSYAVIERPNARRVQIEAFCGNNSVARGLVANFGGSAEPLAAGWQSRFFSAAKTKPLRVGKRLIVASDGDEMPRDSGRARKLIIPASAAFGTGEHATTAMSLRMLERVSRRLTAGYRMLDAGTGSGILALAGRSFGADEVIAIDNDPLAISVARANARANRIRGVTFINADLKRRAPGRFEIVTANLFSELLISLLPQWRKSLSAGGKLILSGVLREQEPELTRALRRNGFEPLEVRRRGKWIALVAAHQKQS